MGHRSRDRQDRRAAGERRRDRSAPHGGGARRAGRRASAGELPRAGDWHAARQQRAADRAGGRALRHRDAGGGRLDLGGGGGRRHRLCRRRSLERDPLGRADRAGTRAAFLRAGQLRGPRDLGARRHAGGLRRAVANDPARGGHRALSARAADRAVAVARRGNPPTRRRQPRGGALRGGQRRPLGRRGRRRRRPAHPPAAATDSSWASRRTRCSPSPTRRCSSWGTRWRTPGGRR